jgi:WD40 repeat protein
MSYNQINFNSNILGVIIGNIHGIVLNTIIRNKLILETLQRIKYSKRILLITGGSNGMITVLHKDTSYVSGSFCLNNPIVSGIHLKENQYIPGLYGNSIMHCLINFEDSKIIKNELTDFKSAKLTTKTLCKIDNGSFACANFNSIFIWNMDSKLNKTIVTDHNEIFLLAKLNDCLICSADSNSVKVWHIETGECVYKLDPYAVEGLINIKENLILTTEANGIVKTWKYANSTTMLSCEIRNPLNTIYSTAIYNDFIAIAEKEIFICNLFTGELCRQLSNKDIITAMIFINKNTLAIAKLDKSIQVMDIIKDIIIRQFNVHCSRIMGLLYNQENSILMSYSSKFVKYIGLNSNFIQFSGHHASINKIIKMNDEFIITCSSDNTIKYWRLSTNKCAKIL